MKRRINSIIILLVSAVIVITARGYGFNVAKIDFIRQEVRGGCESCHEQPSKNVPESHLKATPEEVKHCLNCHSLEGKASVVDWFIHLHHYSQKKFKGDCFSCHLIDEGGNFRLIGAKGEKQIKVTKDMVKRIGAYFQSWATSEHLDHLHAKESITCMDCHERFFPEKNASREQCFSCHGGYKDLATSTKDSHPNPHASHHLNLRCIVCHKAHEKSVLYCNLCHDYRLEVP
jgi:hypothetical protein